MKRLVIISAYDEGANINAVISKLMQDCSKASLDGT